MDTSILKILDRASEKYTDKVVYRDGEENSLDRRASCRERV